jgi:hypothetical protein
VGSDTFARHFASHIDWSNLVRDEKGCLLKSSAVYPLVRTKVLWRGSPISCMKSFGTNKCTLCMKERRIILDRSTRNQGNLINQRTEIYGACRHLPNFHRYCVPATVSTDDEVSTSERIDTNNDSPISTHDLPEICTRMENLTVSKTVTV